MAASPAPRVQPQGVARRPVRDPLRDVRPDAGRRRGRLGSARAMKPDAGRAPSPASTTAARSAATSAAAAEQRTAALDADDLARATADVGAAAVAPRACTDRFPPSRARRDLVDELLDLHTPRQLVGLAAIIDADRGRPPRRTRRCRAPAGVPPRAPAGQPADDGYPGRDRHAPVAGGPRPAARRRHRGASATRGSPSRTASASSAVSSSDSRAARSGRSRRGSARISGASGRAPRPRSSGSARRGLRVRHSAGRPRAVVTPAARASVSCSLSRHSGRTGPARRGVPRRRVGARARGRTLAPAGALAGASLRAPWSWQAAAIGRSLESVAPVVARDGRACSSSTAARRRSSPAVARRRRRGLPPRDRPAGRRRRRAPGWSSWCRPGRAAARPRTRANVALPRSPAARATRTSSPAGPVRAPERFDQRPFSAPEARASVTETAVEMLKARGEPARYERLLGEILVGLDRAGHAPAVLHGRPRASAGSRARARTRLQEAVPRGARHRDRQAASRTEPDPAGARRSPTPGARGSPADEPFGPGERLIALDRRGS